MIEDSLYDKKSLRLVYGKSADYRALAWDCVAFANAQGGTIDIGIEDNATAPPPGQKVDISLVNRINKVIPQYTINVYAVAEKATAANGGEYIKLKVFRSAQSIAGTSDGRYAIRVADESKPVLPDDMTRLAAEKNAFIWETQTTRRIPRNVYDVQKMQNFISTLEQSARVSSFVQSKTPEELLDYFSMASNEYLTNLGILWLGKREHRASLVHSPVIQFTKYDENDKKTAKKVWDDYSQNPLELLNSVLTDIPDWGDGQEISHGIFRTMIPNYDPVVIRELIANALVHRPYTMRGDIFINLFPDRLEVHNPGLLPLGVTPGNILHTSVKRNELLANVFYALGLMEREGSGYDMMYQRLLSQAKHWPIVTEEHDRVVVTIKKRIIKEEIVEFLEKADQTFQLKQREMISLGLIAQHDGLSALEFSRILDVADQERIRSWLGRLPNLGLISSKGRTRGMIYFVPGTVLKKMDFKGKTTLKRIEVHRLEELVRHDLERYGSSALPQIQKRIGSEIPAHRIRDTLGKLIESNVVEKSGYGRWTQYFLCKSSGK